MAGRRASDPLIGRDRELAEVTAALDDALTDRGRVVMLVGEPGIGKTRLCEEVSAVAASKDFAVTVGRALAAAAILPVSETYIGTWSADRVLGLIADALGRPAAAEKHFEDALRFCRKAGYRPELARVCHDYAAALMKDVVTGKRLEPAARVKAALLVNEGLGLATDLGLVPIAAQLSELRDRLGPGGQGDAAPGGLTAWEVEVLRLIATGKSNREIGDALVISENTVIRHVSNILGKIRAANRAEASAYAVRHGLSVE